MNTITIDTTKVTPNTTAVIPTVYLFATHGDFMEWIVNQTKVNIPVLDLQLAKSGTYQFTEYYTVTPSPNTRRWVYAYTFPTPQHHPTKQYTFTTWAVLIDKWDDVLVSAITVNR